MARLRIPVRSGGWQEYCRLTFFGSAHAKQWPQGDTPTLTRKCSGSQAVAAPEAIRNRFSFGALPADSEKAAARVMCCAPRTSTTDRCRRSPPTAAFGRYPAARYKFRRRRRTVTRWRFMTLAIRRVCRRYEVQATFKAIKPDGGLEREFVYYF